jgi:hypothetical protein
MLCKYYYPKRCPYLYQGRREAASQSQGNLFRKVLQNHQIQKRKYLSRRIHDINTLQWQGPQIGTWFYNANRLQSRPCILTDLINRSLASSPRNARSRWVGTHGNAQECTIECPLCAYHQIFAINSRKSRGNKAAWMVVYLQPEERHRLPSSPILTWPTSQIILLGGRTSSGVIYWIIL